MGIGKKDCLAITQNSLMVYSSSPTITNKFTKTLRNTRVSTLKRNKRETDVDELFPKDSEQSI
jgi:chromosomal replication initiation ATPase DnaA